MKRILMLIAAAVTFTGAGAAAETFVVGAYPTNPPWEFKNESSQFEGFEVDLVNEIGERLGVDVDFQDLGFQAIFSAISSGRIDMAISTITITDERLKNQAFTQGYYDSDLALISLKADGVKELEGMRDQVVGVLSSSVAEKWVQENQDEVGFGSVKGYTDQQNLLLDVRSGRLAGAIGDLAGYQFAFQQMPDLNIVQTIATGDRFGIMMPKNSPHLERVNQAITQIKEDGTLAEIHTKWLGVAPDPATSTVQVLPLPQAE